MFSRECLINNRLQCHPDAQFDGTSSMLSLCICQFTSVCFCLCCQIWDLSKWLRTQRTALWRGSKVPAISLQHLHDASLEVLHCLRQHYQSTRTASMIQAPWVKFSHSSWARYPFKTPAEEPASWGQRMTKRQVLLKTPADVFTK